MSSYYGVAQHQTGGEQYEAESRFGGSYQSCMLHPCRGLSDSEQEDVSEDEGSEESMGRQILNLNNLHFCGLHAWKHYSGKLFSCFHK